MTMHCLFRKMDKIRMNELLNIIDWIEMLEKTFEKHLNEVIRKF